MRRASAQTSPIAQRPHQNAMTARLRLPYLAGALALTCLLVLVVTTGQALAATGNAYRSQLSGSATAAKSFSPVGLAVNSSGDVYVGDAPPGHQGAVDEFSSFGAPLGKFLVPVVLGEEEGEELLFVPNGIAVAPSGDVYVADRAGGVVVEYDASGTEVLAEITGAKTKAKTFKPVDVAVNASGDVYVADNTNGVFEFNESGSELLAEFNGGKTAAKSFKPNAIALNASSDVFVTDPSHGVVDEFNASGTGKPIAELVGSETPQGSFHPFKVAVAPSGEVYVGDTAGQLVDRFSSSGAFLSQFEGGATPQGAFEPAGIAVGPSGQVYVGDEAHKVVDVFSPPVTVPSVTTGAASEVQPSSATVAGSIDPAGGPEATCAFSYGTTTSYGASAPCIPAGPFSSLTAVTANLTGLAPSTTYHFRLDGTTTNGTTPGADESFTTSAHIATPPTATIAPVSEVTSSTATFNGEVNPGGALTEYRFEYSSDGVSWTALGAVSAGSGEMAVPVSQLVTGLTPGTTYRVRLEASNTAAEEDTSTEVTFATPARTASAPQVFDISATQIKATGAKLNAVIYPEGEGTTYQFQYGTTTAYGTSAPASPGEPFGAPASVAQQILGLQPATVYHFRILATNATGRTPSPDETFTTLSSEAESGRGACPNESLRAESDVDAATGVPYSAQLPDCRAYEQVTPPFKSFDGVTSAGDELATSSTTAISSSGSPLLEKSTALLGAAGGDEEIVGTSYELGRGASGWSASSLTPPASIFPFSREELASPSDAASGLWAAATPSAPFAAEQFYRREADGTFQVIGPIAPASATAGPPRGASTSPGLPSDAIVGASADLSTTVFQVVGPEEPGEGALWPGDQTVARTPNPPPSLYEYAGDNHSGEAADEPTLVGLTNTGLQLSQCGSGLGADVETEARAVRSGVSAGGSTVFLTAQAGGCAAGATGPSANQAYARVGSPGATQATVNVAGTSECAGSASCNVTSPVTFQGASNDGSRVFFTSDQALLADDKDTTNDIYECELPGDRGPTPTPVGTVDACPSLRAVSVSGTSAEANVQSVVAVSEGGTHVYFTGTGVLTTVPNDQARTAESGRDNLYVWEAPTQADPSGHTSFIATLPGAAPNEAQTTPDGRYLVFTTPADVTADDTSTVAQAFRYDAQTDELVRISVGQNGFADDGNTSVAPAELAKSQLGRVTVSEDGAYIVFQSGAALTPQVDGGVHNVYEWHEGSVSLLSDGTDTRDRDGLVGMDATGANVFFTTADRLVGQDSDEAADVYDARIGGGFPAPQPEASCAASAGCPGPLVSGLATLPLGSGAAPTIGNASAPAPATKGPAAAVKAEVTRHSVKGATITLTVKAPGKGRITVSGAGLKTLKKSVTKAGLYRLKPSLTSKEKKALRHHKRKLKLTVSFLLSGGSSSSTKMTVTLRRS